jgi:hypothetical protein
MRLGHVAGGRERPGLQGRQPRGLLLHRNQQLLLLACGEIRRLKLCHLVEQQRDLVDRPQQRRPERDD